MNVVLTINILILLTSNSKASEHYFMEESSESCQTQQDLDLDNKLTVQREDRGEDSHKEKDSNNKSGKDEKCNNEDNKKKLEKEEDSESEEKVEGNVAVAKKSEEESKKFVEEKKAVKGSGEDMGESQGMEPEGAVRDSQVAEQDTKEAVGESHDDNDKNKKPMGKTKKGDVKNESESKHGSSKEEEFPKDLEGFGYEFNEEGHMVSSETGESFKFEVRVGDKKYNQKRYEALGEIITPMVYGFLEEKTNLVRHIIPAQRRGKEPTSFFFASKDAFTNPEKLMVLIHGSGVVRAGQWSRSLIINDCLNSGTQLPFIERAIKEGYGVVVFNGNRNHEDDDPKKQKIRESSSSEEHGLHVWKNFVSKSKAKVIHLIAHSYGGIVTIELVKAYLDDFKRRVEKIAFTDSVHNLDHQKVSSDARRYVTRVAVNWVSSTDPLDTLQQCSRRSVKRLSAGTPKHPETSWFAYESIFKFLKEPLQAVE